MSSISQMERSSSQTRMLATPTPSGRGQHASLIRRVLIGGGGTPGIEAVQPQHERGSLPGLGSSPHLAAMRLHNLIDNRQPQPGTAFEVRLKGLEDFFDLLRTHASSSIGESDLPILSQGLDCDCEGASDLRTFHGANRMLTKIPKYLLDLAPTGDRPSLASRKPVLDRDAGYFRRHAVIHKRQRIFDELDEIDLVKMILLGTRIGQEVGNDAVQTLRLAGHDVEQAAMILIHLGDAGEHADRTGDGGQRIADFVGDGCGQPADGGQTVLHSYFALQPSNLGEI